MKMIVKRRQIVIAALVVALGAAVFVNWYATRPEVEKNDTGTNLGDAQYVNAEAQETTAPQQEYFSEAIVKRTQAHAEAQSLLESVIKDTSATEPAKQTATEALGKLSALIKSEADIENIIKAKLKSNCLVILDGTTAQAILTQGTLNDTVAMQVKEIIISHTDISAENIIIFEAK